MFFLELRDGTGFVQVVAETPKLAEQIVQDLKSLTLESSVSLEGTVAAHPMRKGEFELQLSALRVLQIAQEYPLGRKEHGPDFLLDNRHLWLRSKKQYAIQRIRNTAINAIYDFFAQHSFVKIDSPVITAVACEGTTTLFELDYFDLGKAFLSQSGQLYLEAAIFAHGRVFDFGPVFRAERSKTKKHLIEFWMMNAEMAFFEHEDNMRLQEQLVCFVLERVLQHNREHLKLLERDVAKLEAIKAPFPRLTHAQAVEQLRAKGSSITPEMDLGAGDEALLSELYNQPVFIERWPAAIKAFYMKRAPENSAIVLGSDLMAPEGFGELIGGSQREDNLELLTERMNSEGISTETYSWYLDTRRYGSVPHSGFGIGLERLVCWLSGAQHIRETIPFPRMLYRNTP
jgi:asparaginyl-tRNA synthetase